MIGTMGSVAGAGAVVGGAAGPGAGGVVSRPRLFGRLAAQAAARARRAKARVACAASLPRWIYCMVVHDTSWDPAVASGAASRHDTPRTQAEAA